MEDRFWELICLKLTGKISVEELTELNLLSTEDADALHKIHLLEQMVKTNETNSDMDIELAFSKHLQRLNHSWSNPVLKYETPVNELPTAKTNNVNKWFRTKYLVVSGIASLIVIFFFLSHFNVIKNTENRQIAQNTVVTKKGAKSKIRLPDGSQVWLNSDSKIIYDEKFGDATRNVHLIGEAFFDVVKDKNHPFIIHTSSMNVKVLGTAFNVRCYPEENFSETALIRGSVEIVLNGKPNNKYFLKPNEKIMIQAKSTHSLDTALISQKTENHSLTFAPLHYLKRDSSVLETSWVSGKLAFDGESLEKVSKEIERWYDVKIIIEDEELKGNEYHAVFENESIREIMNALQTVGNFHYEIKKNTITIKKID